MQVRFATPVTSRVVTFSKYLPPSGWKLKYSERWQREYYVHGIKNIAQWTVPGKMKSCKLYKEKYKQHRKLNLLTKESQNDFQSK